MHIISKKKITDFSIIHPNAKTPLEDWYKVMKKIDFKTPSELQALFPDVDQVGRKTVFNIKGNDYRLIARVNYSYKKAFILHILTHAEYDKEKWKE